MATRLGTFSSSLAGFLKKRRRECRLKAIGYVMDKFRSEGESDVVLVICVNEIVELNGGKDVQSQFYGVVDLLRELRCPFPSFSDSAGKSTREILVGSTPAFPVLLDTSLNCADNVKDPSMVIITKHASMRL